MMMILCASIESTASTAAVPVTLTRKTAGCQCVGSRTEKLGLVRRSWVSYGEVGSRTEKLGRVSYGEVGSRTEK
uniref:Secreted protein n=1 Tax=Knipowitschia caucasica TaxID=637954 RepID=A0AAV2LWU7_KNICA